MYRRLDAQNTYGRNGATSRMLSVAMKSRLKSTHPTPHREQKYGQYRYSG
jgi:hypothetical protein